MWLSPLWEGVGPSYIKNWIRCFEPSLVENVPVVLEKKISKSFQNFFLLFCNYLQLFCNYLHFEKGLTLHLKYKKIKSSSRKDFVWQVSFKSTQCILILPNYLFKEGLATSFEQTWIPFTQARMLCAMFGCSRTNGSGEEYFSKFSMNFYFFTIISPFIRT